MSMLLLALLLAAAMIIVGTVVGARISRPR